MQPSERATADRLKVYALCEALNLYTLACLAHGADPERVANNTHDEWSKRWREVHGMTRGPTPLEFAGLLDAMPEAILGDQIGGTLKALCIATGGNFQRAVPIAEARRLLVGLGLDLPAELGHAESPAERRARRLKRFRELGGKMRPGGSGWQCTGRRGALADLAREEAAAGRPRADRSDVRRDLTAEMGAHGGC